jgi:hypothetical protein
MSKYMVATYKIFYRLLICCFKFSFGSACVLDLPVWAFTTLYNYSI